VVDCVSPFENGFFFKALFSASEDGKGARRTFVTGAFRAAVAESNAFQF
jgi:hypothetical protein